jgi:hypothetical protein
MGGNYSPDKLITLSINGVKQNSKNRSRITGYFPKI